MATTSPDSTIADASPPPKLLVIDDEPTILKLVKTMLARAGYQAVTASSADEGLKLLDQGGFDCVITDSLMPVMNGNEFARAVRANPAHSGTPILMLTRKRDRRDVASAVEAGVSDYVLKPIDEQLLLDKVESCLRKGAGKRHIFVCPVNGERARAKITISCQVTSISESDMTLRLPFAVPDELAFELAGRLFDEIGIRLPMAKLIGCRPLPDPDPVSPNLVYEAKYAFMGVQENELRLIRAWLQKQAVQLRK